MSHNHLTLAMCVAWRELASKDLRPSQPTERDETLASGVQEHFGEPFGDCRYPIFDNSYSCKAS